MEASPEQDRKFFFNFSFFKLDPKWRWMADLAKEESAKEVENVIANTGIRFRSYSTLGLRDDADFLFWFASESIEDIQSAISKLYLTVFGKYISPSQVYLSSTRPSIYAKTGRTLSFLSGDEPKKVRCSISFHKNKRMVSFTRRPKTKNDE